MLSEDTGKALPGFQFLKSLGDSFPNTEIAYTIMLTVVRGERSFSKLKMIKNCLRAAVTQERLGGLADLPIEKDDIDYINLFAETAASKSRKVVFM
jgi:hypothetical protein